MADDGSGEKTEEPTDKKIRDARKKGQVWKSKDLSGVIGLMVGLGVVKAIFPLLKAEISKLMSFGLERLAHPEDLLSSAYAILMAGLVSMLLISIPVVFACAISEGVTDFLLIGPLLAIESIMPKLEKLNPVQGIKNMFSKKQLVELLKNLVKIGVTGYVVFGVVRDAVDIIGLTIRGDEHRLLDVMGELIFRIALRVVLLFLIFAIFDVWWQHHAFRKEMMMTKDEVKREYKETEGDPYHKAHRKQMHHEILEQAAQEGVRKADVVVTNPEHIAVALQYDRDQDQAPRVIFKGLDSKAERIREIARESEVPIMRNVPLAHALFRVDVGEEIPEELYDAVAEVLNFVYGLKEQQVKATAS
jgi:flagellar biosynthesis protein FlhB